MLNRNLNETVRLYYLGGLQDDDNQSFLVRTRQKVFTIPPAGNFIEVMGYEARDLIARHKITDVDHNGNVIRRRDAFTLDVRTAELFKNGQVEIRDDGLVVEKPTYTRDELLAMLENMDGEGATENTPTETTTDKSTVKDEPVESTPARLPKIKVKDGK